MLTVLLGGARSGKSTLAVELGTRAEGPVVFIATAEAFDDDLRSRIERHQAERPPWPTVEAPVDLATAIESLDDDALAIVDCLTVWLANLLHHVPDAPARAEHIERFLAALARRKAPTVVVSNEVGLGLHPETPLGREYRDELGRLNQRVAAQADRVLLLVAGRALPLTDPWSLL